MRTYRKTDRSAEIFTDRLTVSNREIYINKCAESTVSRYTVRRCKEIQTILTFYRPAYTDKDRQADRQTDGQTD